MVRSLGLVEAFARHGARQANAQWAVTAVAEDGSLVVSCWQHLFSRPSRDVMRYEDRLSRRKCNERGGLGEAAATIGSKREREPEDDLRHQVDEQRGQ